MTLGDNLYCSGSALPVEITDDLPDYDELNIGATGILIGNGASQAVWSRFGCGSLHDTARASDNGPVLDSTARQLFSELQTRNFEQVLLTLAAARLVNRLLNLPLPEIEAQYDLIRSALVHAVHSVHVKRSKVPDSTLNQINANLRRYKHVYSTNYDLLIYWAVMQDQVGFKDYFWGPQFDWPKPTSMMTRPESYISTALSIYLSTLVGAPTKGKTPV